MRKLITYLHSLLPITGLVSCSTLLAQMESLVSPYNAANPGSPPSGDRVRVIHVIDGDTIDAEDLLGKEYRERYIGVDAPEQDEA